MTTYFLLGSPEPMERERWAWEAIYSDGTSLKQFDDETKQFHMFNEIDQSKLLGFAMVSYESPPILIHWKPGRKLIHFYRNVRLNVGTPEEIFVRVYCFGYESETDKVIIAIMPDNQIRILEDVETLQIG